MGETVCSSGKNVLLPYPEGNARGRGFPWASRRVKVCVGAGALTGRLNKQRGAGNNKSLNLLARVLFPSFTVLASCLWGLPPYLQCLRRIRALPSSCPWPSLWPWVRSARRSRWRITPWARFIPQARQSSLKVALMLEQGLGLAEQPASL